MRKLLLVLVLALMGLSPIAFAQGAIISDAEMEGISAGDWVILTDTENADQEVVDVWYNANDIKLQDEAQMDLKAVNQANAVDSAIAVQTNIARVTGEEPTQNVAVNGTNDATLLNYNPSDSGSMYVKHSTSEFCTYNENMDVSGSSSESSSITRASGSESTCMLDYDETLDVDVAASAAGESSDKSGDSECASALAIVVNYDKTIDADGRSASWDNCSFEASKECTLDIAKSKCMMHSEKETCEAGSEYRKNLSENNHIALEDTCQTRLMAVSNLNAVGSAAAMQTNIASNVGATGSFTHMNKAVVTSGL